MTAADGVKRLLYKYVGKRRKLYKLKASRHRASKIRAIDNDEYNKYQTQISRTNA